VELTDDELELELGKEWDIMSDDDSDDDRVFREQLSETGFATVKARPSVEMTDDVRSDHERCAICLGWVHRQRKVKLGDHQYAHGYCASVEQEGEWVLRHWLAEPVEVRRQRIMQHYGFDPLTEEPVTWEVEWTEVIEDVDGIPAGLDVERTNQSRIPVLGVPHCRWDIARERGWA
jgi:hypothetical protein